MKFQIDGVKLQFNWITLFLSILFVLQSATVSAKKPTKDLFPDGTEVPAWFRDTTHVDISHLGRQYRITDYGVMMDGKIYTQQLQALIDRMAADGGGVSLGYNVLYFEYTLPNGATAQILDIFDYVSNNLLMPFISISTCILIGWVVKPNLLIGEMRLNGYQFKRKPIYIIMLKYIVPLILTVLLLGAFGLY